MLLSNLWSVLFPKSGRSRDFKKKISYLNLNNEKIFKLFFVITKIIQLLFLLNLKFFNFFKYKTVLKPKYLTAKKGNDFQFK